VEALSPERGASAIHEDEARVNKQLATRAEQVIVVTDSSKFSRKAFANIVPLGDIDVVITDSGISSNFIELFRDMQVELVMV